MVVFFIFVSMAFAIIYILSWGKYNEFIEPLDRKQYPLKLFLPMGLYLMDMSKHTYNTRYDRWLLSKITELYGPKYCQYYLRIHWANKLVFFMAAILLTVLIGLSTGPDVGLAIFGIIVAGSLVYFTDNDLKDKIKKRRLAIQMDFPDFLNKLVLLINAGMTVTRAWEKAVSDNRKDSILYEELDTVLLDIRSGKSDYQAYEDFSKRCRTPEITRFMSVLIQNLRKGNSDMVSMLRLQANECWEMRKNAAKKLGEEASTKMLLPMMIMFIAILIIVAAPAILAMQGI